MEPFCDYLASKRRGGTDIDNWAMTELVDAVAEFERGPATPLRSTLNSPSQSRISSIRPSVLQRNSSPVAETLPRSTLKPIVRDSVFVSRKSIGGVKPQVTVMPADSKQQNFTLTLHPQGVSVIRKWQDLMWLRAKLQAEFPYCYLPPVRCKTMRSAFLQSFFDRLMDMKVVQKSEVLRLFFDEVRFKSLKTEEPRSVETAMLERLQRAFADPGLRQVYNGNMATYSAYFTRLIINYQPGETNTDFSSYLREIEQMSAVSARHFSNLKHEAADLAQNLGRAAANIVEIARIFDVYLFDIDKHHKKAGLLADPSVMETHSRLRASFMEWSQILLRNKEIVGESLVSFFQFKKHENVSLSHLTKMSLDTTTSLYKKAADLEHRKRKLFDEKKLAQWKVESADIKDDFNDLINDYSRARRYILPADSQTSALNLEVARYIAMHTIFEFVNFHLNSLYYFERNFKDMGEKFLLSHDMEMRIWSGFNLVDIDVSTLDREGVTVMSKDAQEQTDRNLVIRPSLDRLPPSRIG